MDEKQWWKARSHQGDPDAAQHRVRVEPAAAGPGHLRRPHQPDDREGPGDRAENPRSWSNSAFYGFKSKISDIRSAVIMLGFNAVRNAIVSVSVIEAFAKKLKLEDFDIADFWKHSLAVAVTSKSISYKTRINSPDNCFVGGLLHDVGKVIMAQYFQDPFAAVWNACRQEAIAFHDAERKRGPGQPCRHRRASRIPLAAAAGVDRGDSLASRLSSRQSQNAEFSLIIYLANIIVNSYDQDPDCLIDIGRAAPGRPQAGHGRRAEHRRLLHEHRRRD
ncbi:MAG: HDOD domain-containing protein [Desulfobacterales bacterium]|nr:HDOD domain-containing protein [Desulfobacterales bacterium]